MAGIKVINVSKTLENLFTLNNISLTVKCHEIAVILGPSGCGKSTLLNIISGLISPDQGRIELEGEDWTGRTGRISYMQQKDLLLPSQNILGNVCIPLLLKGMRKNQAQEKARGFLKDFGLDGFETYYPRHLSGGMRQRAALLRTYLFTSDIMLMDEPFARLDAITRRDMHKWLMELWARSRPTVLFVTHDIDEALLLADSIYVFSPRPGQIKLHIELQPGSDEKKPEWKQQILTLLEAEQ
ncbi:MAG: ABC transporter ATP-binding protein [Firmicutes bacterium]|nr:ABC transporter ATP-binding protein [Bacillota bacterium]